MRTMRARLRRLVIVIMVPMIVLVATLIGLLMWYIQQYETLLDNVTSASAFNQDFKNDVDLKMFYYVSDSAYSEGIPYEEVASARELAEQLLQQSTEKKSIEAIESVRDLCKTLELRMQDIDDTASYDDRMMQLENNIYILTDLIQTYMYNYLYYESVHLNLLQQEIYRQVTLLMIVLGIVSVALVLLVVAYSRRITNNITEPLTSLSKRVDDITSGDFTPRKPIEASEVEIQALSDGLENMAGQLNTLIAENKRVERRKRHAELELLQAQINPHFLYNTLDTIIWLIESDAKEKSINMVSSLSDFFRSSLSRGQDTITLAEEQKHVLAYLQIQSTRYQDRMDYEISIPDSLLEYVLPKLTLQPLVENSIYHGIKLQREKGFVKVSGVDLGDTIELRVVDNGAGMSEERLWELKNAMTSGDKVGFGLRTVHQRLQLMFGEEYGLTLQSTEGVGTTIIATIPKQRKENREDAVSK